MKSNSRSRENIIGSPIDIVSWDRAISLISNWSTRRLSRVVCICNVHSVVTALQDPSFAKVVCEADLATPDGAPIAWLLRRLGAPDQQRINGPDLMWRYCQHAAVTGESIYLLGSTESTLAALICTLKAAFPNLHIAGHCSPPFRLISPIEDQQIIDGINNSGATVVWVSLGCPKQEFWMAEHRNRINAVMVGVGAAFDYHAAVVKRAPLWMQAHGLEWLYRFLSEPKRLWRRYLITNSLFIWHASRQLVEHKLNRK